MSNHLIIGIGGTGLTMVRALRCVISQELEYDSLHGPFTSPEQKFPHEVKLRYLEIDSSPHDLSCNFEGCTPICGPSLKLEKDFQLNLEAHGLLGTNQSRTMGAELFAQKTCEFDEKVNLLMRGLQSFAPVDVHICAGLGGGTGSGAIVDAVCRIRQLYKLHSCGPATSARIFLYLALPQHSFSGALPQYEPNGYAALAELSSLNTRQWTPLDKAPGAGKPYLFEAERWPENRPLEPVFSACYLFNEDCAKSKGRPMHDQNAQLFGHFLYEKIFVWPSAGEGAAEGVTALRRADENEDLNVFMHEYSYDMDADAIREEDRGDGRLEDRLKQAYAIHSNRFHTVGLKRLSVPIQEIRNHNAAVLANEGLLQLCYNRPTADGYDDPEASHDTPEKKHSYQHELHNQEQKLMYEIRRDLLRWNLVEDGVITCQMKCLPGDPTENISRNWQSLITDKYQALSEDKNWRGWCDSLRDSVERHYAQGYHTIPGQPNSEGVEEFYSSQRGMIPARVRAHVSRWEKEYFIARLFSTDERISLQEMHLTIKALHKALTENLIERLKNNISTLDATICELDDKASQQLEKFRRLGWLSGLFYKREYFQAYRELLSALYIARTQKCACEYARQYLHTLADKTRRMQETSSRILASIDKVLRGIYKPGTILLEQEGIQSIIHNTCPRNDDLHKALERNICVKVYDPDCIQRNDRELKANNCYTETYLPAIHAALRDMLEAGGRALEDTSLAELLELFDGPEVMQVLLRVCRNIVVSHPDFQFTQDFKLNREIHNTYRGTDQYHLADQLYNTSGLSLQTSATELVAAICNNARLSYVPHETSAVFMSDCNAELVADLENGLQGHFGPWAVTHHDSDTEMRITHIANALPPRAYLRVHELHEAFLRYRQEYPNAPIFTDATEPFPQFFPTQEDILALYRGTKEEYLSSPENIVKATPHGCLLKRFLLGKVTCRECGPDRKMFWCTETADSFGAYRPLCPKVSDCFLMRDYLEAVYRSVVQALNPDRCDFTCFYLPHLYREMRQTEELWQAIVNPPRVTDQVLAARNESLARLDELVRALQTQYPDECSREHRHASILHQWYGQQLGRC